MGMGRRVQAGDAMIIPVYALAYMAWLIYKGPRR